MKRERFKLFLPALLSVMEGQALSIEFEICNRNH